MIIDLKKALVEVLEILKYVPEKNKEVIPNELLQSLEKEKDKNYKFELDKTKDWTIQISDFAKEILSHIYIKYWVTDYERKVIQAKENQIMREWEELKRKRYPVDNIFGNKK